MELRVLGPLEVVDGRRAVDIGGTRQRRLLCALLAGDGEPVPVERLLERVWDDRERPAEQVSALRTYISRLRTSLPRGDELIVTRRGGYALELNGHGVDVTRFEMLVAASGRAADGGDLAEAIRAADEALALWRGRALQDVADLPWAVPEARRLEELRRGLEEDRFDALLAAGRAGEAVAELEAAVAVEPLRERRQAQLMVALYRCGRQADALRAYARYRSQLATETGLEPGEAVRALESRILASDPSLLAAAVDRRLRSYVLGAQLGEGAFSIVWQARQPSVGREVAIKQIRAELTNRPEFVRRFEAEAHLVARLEHPHIVPLYDYWREPDSAYLVMRLLRAGTLQERIDREGGLPLPDCTRLAAEVGAALATAHRAGVVHRDVKPGNVFCDSDGHFYLGDFGIALDIAQSVDPESSLSAGSPAYASPEQLRREPVGVAADIHALGVTLYEALTGRIPFPNEPNQAALLQRQLRDPIPSARSTRAELPAALDKVIARATAKAPADRFESVQEMVSAFVEAATGEEAAPQVARRQTATMVGFGGANPYKGLRPFTEADAGDFYGRDRLVAELIERLRRPSTDGRIVTVVGPSGSGKSSVVRAGLLPALRAGMVEGSDRWFTVNIVPSRHPFEELEAGLIRIAVNPPERLLDQLTDGPRGIARAVKRVLGDDQGELLLVVDQFEELFTLCDNETERALFLDGLSEAARDPRTRLRLILTIRADFVDRPLRVSGFAGLLKESAVLVTPLAPDELERAISEPAHRAGCELEPGLLARIVADVADQPGALPLLQYVLTELYERRVSGLMTVAAYDEVGGLVGALARRADELTDALDMAGQDAARRLFGRLVSLGEGSEDTRRRVLRAELAGVPGELIDTFGAARLLSFDQEPVSREPTVEVAHEALIRQWPRLRSWLEVDRDGLRVLRHLTESSAAWGASGRDDGELYRGGRLEAAEVWAQEHPAQLNDAEAEFLRASAVRRDHERRAARRQVRRLRGALAGAGIVAAVAVVAGLLAWRQRDRADNEAMRAKEQTVLADANAAQAETRRLVADAAAMVGENRAVALLLASEAYRRDPGPQTLAGLQRVLTSTGPYLGTLGAGQDFLGVEVLEDGTIVGLTSTAIQFYDPATSALVRSVPIEMETAANRLANRLAVSGNVVAAATAGGVVTVVDAEQVRRWPAAAAPLRSVALGAGTLAVGSGDGFVHLFDLTSGQKRWSTQVMFERTFREVMPAAWEALAPSTKSFLTSAEPSLLQSGPAGIVVEPSGRVIVSGHLHLSAIDGGTGQILRRVLHPSLSSSIPISAGLLAALPDGRFVGASFFNALVFDSSLNLLEIRFVPTGRADLNVSVLAVAVAPDGTPHWGLSDGQITRGLVESPRGGDREPTGLGSTNGLAFARDGRLLVAGSGGIVAWGIDGHGLLNRAVPSGGHNGATIAADGSLVLLDTLGNYDRPNRLYDLSHEPARLVDRPFLAGRSYAITPDPLGRYEDTWLNGDRRFLDRTTLAEVGRLSGSFLEFSADGRRLVNASYDSTSIRVYDAATFEPVSPTLDISPWKVGLTGAAPGFDHTGNQVFVSLVRVGTTIVYDTATWAQTKVIDRTDHGGVIAARFSEDGSTLVTLGLDGSISLREPKTWAYQRTLAGGISSADTLAQSFFLTRNGEYLVTARDGKPRLWHLPTSTLIGAFPHKSGLVPAGNDLGEGLQLVTLDDARAYVWNLDVNMWPELACKAAGRNFTQAEWDQFGPKGMRYQQTCRQWPAAG